MNNGFTSGVELIGPDCPIRVFAIPACDAGIDRGDVLQRVSARGSRRIILKPIFENQPADLSGPVVVCAQTADSVFPETGGRVGLGRAREVLDLGEFGGFFW